MKSLPPEILRLIRRTINHKIHPLCLYLDQHFVIKAWLGDPDYFGFAGLQQGLECKPLIPFLYGLEASDSLTFHFVETPNGLAVHAELINAGDDKVLVLIDATEHRRSHAEVQQKANELSLLHAKQKKLIESMTQLERELELKHKELADANRLKSDFIGHMSHEFRTPLTSILGYAQRLQPHLQSDPGRLKLLSSIDRSARHLLSLVENLLDQSQIEANSLSITPVQTRLNAVLDELAGLFAPLADDKQLQFHMRKKNIPELLLIDELRLRQIIVNLIGNAIKFTERGFVNCEVFWHKDQIELTVLDSGIGIKTVNQQRIFSAFEQLDNKPGAGLGLAIVKHIVVSLGGELDLESASGKGSRFKIIIPAPQIQSDTPKLDTAKINNGAMNNLIQTQLKNVLIVEDDPDILDLTEGIFREAGYRTLAAVDGEQAIETALSASPDLILMDLNLPKLDGIDAIRRLRTEKFLQPIFVLSAYPSAENKHDALQAGANEYLLKPIDVQRLLNLAAEYFFKEAELGMPIERYRQLCERYQISLANKKAILQQFLHNRQNTDLAVEECLELRIMAHQLAGSAETYGFTNITLAAREMDVLFLDIDCPTSCVIVKLEGEVLKVIEQLHQAISIATTHDLDNQRTI